MLAAGSIVSSALPPQTAEQVISDTSRTPVKTLASPGTTAVNANPQHSENATGTPAATNTKNDTRSTSASPSNATTAPGDAPEDQVPPDDSAVPPLTSSAALPTPANMSHVLKEALQSGDTLPGQPDKPGAVGSDSMFAKENAGVLTSSGPRPGRANGDQLPEYDFSHPTSGGTNVYIIAIIGVVPAAGAVVWCVRKMITKRGKDDKLPSEETGDKDKDKADQDPPTKYSYIQQAYNNAFIKNVDEVTATAPPRGVCPAPPEEFPRNDLQLEKVLGEGNFGRVWKATAFGLRSRNKARPVAVKTIKEYATNDEKRDLIREMQVMRELGKHPNVVEYLGCCTQDEPMLLIMELVSRGKLLTYLRDHRSKGAYYNFPEGDGVLGPRDLTQFAYQVAQGMDYINKRGILHRDLATRNILVDEHNRCKVADFGLSRSIRDSETDVYHQKSKGALPVRWMAPECLYLQVFTTKSDVWAFGILLWEIVTLGSTPYPGLSAQEVIRHVRDGQVMGQPVHCRWELYRVMRSCWNPDPNERPSFTELSSDLDKLIKLNAGYIDLDNFPEHAYCNMYYGVDEKL